MQCSYIRTGNEMNDSCSSSEESEDCERCSVLEKEVEKERLKCKSLEVVNMTLLTE